MSSVKFSAVLIGGALGAAIAMLSIDFFHSTAEQLGYLAACAIFGAIVCAVGFPAMRRGDRKFERPGPSRAFDAHELPKKQRAHPTDSPPLSPK